LAHFRPQRDGRPARLTSSLRAQHIMDLYAQRWAIETASETMSA